MYRPHCVRSVLTISVKILTASGEIDVLTLLREMCTWFALDSMVSCPPKEMGDTSEDKVNKFVATLEVKNKN